MGVVAVDSAAVLLEYLLLDEPSRDGVESLVEHLGGLYVACPVAPASFRNNHKAVIFHPEVETMHTTGADTTTIFTCKCYPGSDSYAEARGVFRALVDHLHDVRQRATSAGMLRAAWLIEGFQGPAEPETGWPVYVAKFSVTTAV